MLRWLVDGVPDTVDVHTVTDRVEPGETVTLVADVVDRAFVELNDARVVARRRRPNGAIEDVPDPVDRASRTASTARRFAPERGRALHRRRRGRPRHGTPIGSSATQVRAVPSDAEYFDATMQAARLKRIADETGGRFYTAGKPRGPCPRTCSTPAVA